MKIYHNPRCGKSRDTLALIREAGIEPEIVEYLKTPPAPSEIQSLLEALGLPAESVVRKGEPVFLEKCKGKTFSEAEWVQMIAENPILLERPIVIKGKKAIIGRPPERVKTLL